MKCGKRESEKIMCVYKKWTFITLQIKVLTIIDLTIIVWRGGGAEFTPKAQLLKKM